MTAIVMNTATAAVTEYDWTFESVTAQHAGGNSLALLGGDADVAAPIAAEFRSGKPAGEKMLSVGNVYLAMEADGDGELIVEGRTDAWFYPALERTSGIARAKPGRGIRESRLGFGYRNTAGAYFRLDRIDAEVTESTTRRV